MPKQHNPYFRWKPAGSRKKMGSRIDAFLSTATLTKRRKVGALWRERCDVAVQSTQIWCLTRCFESFDCMSFGRKGPEIIPDCSGEHHMWFYFANLHVIASHYLRAWRTCQLLAVARELITFKEMLPRINPTMCAPGIVAWAAQSTSESRSPHNHCKMDLHDQSWCEVL